MVRVLPAHPVSAGGCYDKLDAHCMLPALWSSTAPLQPECTHAPLLFGCRLSVAECGRVQGLYLTKQVRQLVVVAATQVACEANQMKSDPSVPCCPDLHRHGHRLPDAGGGPRQCGELTGEALLRFRTKDPRAVAHTRRLQTAMHQPPHPPTPPHRWLPPTRERWRLPPRPRWRGWW